MNNHQIIARRYAKGLMMAVETKDLDTLALDLNDLVVLMSSHKDLAYVFSDPSFLPQSRKGIINGIADKANMLPSLRNFLLLLVDKGRIRLLPQIRDALIDFIDDQAGRVRATIKSASPLNEQEVSNITGALTALSKKIVTINAQVDEALLGGIRVEMAGTIFDGTVRAKLDALKSQLVTTN